MTTEQGFLFALFAGIFILLIWGRIRYDLVAFGALVTAIIGRFVKPDDVFLGFGHPAVVIIGLVLIVSKGLLNSGAVEMIAGVALSSNPHYHYILALCPWLARDSLPSLIMSLRWRC